jgi:energy-coupling factor transport system ATP-binding protein
MHDGIFSLDNVRFQFPEAEHPLLNGVTFEIPRGERVAISGPSGSGKSTLLYLLNRLYPANCDGIVSGAIRLFGKSADEYDAGEINHRVATVFQDPDSQFCMPTVEEELAFTLENLSVAADVMETRIAAVLDWTGLENLRHAVIQSLSGGMKQRIATACALVMEPEVLLLDEPLSHLDPHTARQFIGWLDELQKKHALTIVAVEHRLDLWGSFFNRELALGTRGTIISDAPFHSRQAVVFPSRTPSLVEASALRAVGISVEKGGKSLLAPLSFEAASGEVVVIAGPNGSGKTTLLKALCGILPLSAGLIETGGIGYVPQSPEYLFLETTVEAELAFSGASSKQELDELMDRLRLTEIKGMHPFAVSHGQKRRVAIGAMLADKRRVLLMDEPTSGQDRAALLELWSLIKERALEGATCLIVTHDMEFAAGIADAILLIKEGQLTGKFPADTVWTNNGLLAQHGLLPPERMMQRAQSFA